MISIVPTGFEKSSHPVFSKFSPPSIFCHQRNNSQDSIVKVSSQDLSSGSLPSHVPASDPDPPTANFNCAVSSTATEPSAVASESLHGHCAICLSAYDEPVTLVECRHSFCLACARQWFLTVSLPRCPLCQNEDAHFIKYTSSGNVGRLELWSFKSSVKGMTLCMCTTTLEFR